MARLTPLAARRLLAVWLSLALVFPPSVFAQEPADADRAAAELSARVRAAIDVVKKGPLGGDRAAWKGRVDAAVAALELPEERQKAVAPPLADFDRTLDDPRAKPAAIVHSAEELVLPLETLLADLAGARGTGERASAASTAQEQAPAAKPGGSGLSTEGGQAQFYDGAHAHAGESPEPQPQQASAIALPSTPPHAATPAPSQNPPRQEAARRDARETAPQAPKPGPIAESASLVRASERALEAAAAMAPSWLVPRAAIFQLGDQARAEEVAERTRAVLEKYPRRSGDVDTTTGNPRPDALAEYREIEGLADPTVRLARLKEWQARVDGDFPGNYPNPVFARKGSIEQQLDAALTEIRNRESELIREEFDREWERGHEGRLDEAKDPKLFARELARFVTTQAERLKTEIFRRDEKLQELSEAVAALEADQAAFYRENPMLAEYELALRDYRAYEQAASARGEIPDGASLDPEALGLKIDEIAPHGLPVKVSRDGLSGYRFRDRTGAVHEVLTGADGGSVQRVERDTPEGTATSITYFAVGAQTPSRVDLLGPSGRWAETREFDDQGRVSAIRTPAGLTKLEYGQTRSADHPDGAAAVRYDFFPGQPPKDQPTRRITAILPEVGQRGPAIYLVDDLESRVHERHVFSRQNGALVETVDESTIRADGKFYGKTRLAKAPPGLTGASVEFFDVVDGGVTVYQNNGAVSARPLRGGYLAVASDGTSVQMDGTAIKNPGDGKVEVIGLAAGKPVEHGRAEAERIAGQGGDHPAQWLARRARDGEIGEHVNGAQLSQIAADLARYPDPAMRLSMRGAGHDFTADRIAASLAYKMGWDNAARTAFIERLEDLATTLALAKADAGARGQVPGVYVTYGGSLVAEPEASKERLARGEAAADTRGVSLNYDAKRLSELARDPAAVETEAGRIAERLGWTDAERRRLVAHHLDGLLARLKSGNYYRDMDEGDFPDLFVTASGTFFEYERPGRKELPDGAWHRYGSLTVTSIFDTKTEELTGPDGKASGLSRVSASDSTEAALAFDPAAVDRLRDAEPGRRAELLRGLVARAAQERGDWSAEKQALVARFVGMRLAQAKGAKSVDVSIAPDGEVVVTVDGKRLAARLGGGIARDGDALVVMDPDLGLGKDQREFLSGYYSDKLNLPGAVPRYEIADGKIYRFRYNVRQERDPNSIERLAGEKGSQVNRLVLETYRVEIDESGAASGKELLVGEYDFQKYLTDVQRLGKAAKDMTRSDLVGRPLMDAGRALMNKFAKVWDSANAKIFSDDKEYAAFQRLKAAADQSTLDDISGFYAHPFSGPDDEARRVADLYRLHDACLRDVAPATFKRIMDHLRAGGLSDIKAELGWRKGAGSDEENSRLLVAMFPRPDNTVLLGGFHRLDIDNRYKELLDEGRRTGNGWLTFAGYAQHTAVGVGEALPAMLVPGGAAGAVVNATGMLTLIPGLIDAAGNASAAHGDQESAYANADLGAAAAQLVGFHAFSKVARRMGERAAQKKYQAAREALGESGAREPAYSMMSEEWDKSYESASVERALKIQKAQAAAAARTPGSLDALRELAVGATPEDAAARVDAARELEAAAAADRIASAEDADAVVAGARREHLQKAAAPGIDARTRAYLASDPFGTARSYGKWQDLAHKLNNGQPGVEPLVSEAEVTGARERGLVVQNLEQIPSQEGPTCTLHAWANALSAAGHPTTIAEVLKIVEARFGSETLERLKTDGGIASATKMLDIYKVIAEAKGVGVETVAPEKLFKTIQDTGRGAAVYLEIGGGAHMVMIEGVVPTEKGPMVSMMNSSKIVAGRMYMPLADFAAMLRSGGVLPGEIISESAPRGPASEPMRPVERGGAASAGTIGAIGGEGGPVDPAAFLRKRFGENARSAKAFDLVAGAPEISENGMKVASVGGSYFNEAKQPRTREWPKTLVVDGIETPFTARDAIMMTKVPAEASGRLPARVQALLELREKLGGKAGLPSDLDIAIRGENVDALEALRERVFQETGMLVEFTEPEEHGGAQALGAIGADGPARAPSGFARRGKVVPVENLNPIYADRASMKKAFERGDRFALTGQNLDRVLPKDPSTRFNYVIVELPGGSIEMDVGRVTYDNPRELGVKHAQIADGRPVLFSGEILKDPRTGRVEVDFNSGTFSEYGKDPGWAPTPENVAALQAYAKAILGQDVVLIDHRNARTPVAPAPPPAPPAAPRAPPAVPLHNAPLTPNVPLAVDYAPGRQMRVALGPEKNLVVSRVVDLPDSFRRAVPNLDNSVGYVVYDPANPVEFKALRDGETVSLGCASPGRFDMPRTVSGRHVEITRLGNRVEFRDLGSRNGTRVSVEPDAARPRGLGPIGAADAPNLPELPRALLEMQGMGKLGRNVRELSPEQLRRAFAENPSALDGLVPESGAAVKIAAPTGEGPLQARAAGVERPANVVVPKVIAEGPIPQEPSLRVIVMEKAGGVGLDQYLGDRPAQKLPKAISAADWGSFSDYIRRLNEQGVVHGDLDNPENVRVTMDASGRTTFTLIDFGEGAKPNAPPSDAAGLAALRAKLVAKGLLDPSAGPARAGGFGLKRIIGDAGSRQYMFRQLAAPFAPDAGQILARAVAAPEAVGNLSSDVISRQKYSDCAVNAMYNNPALEPVRQALQGDYKRFLVMTEKLAGERLRDFGTWDHQAKAVLNRLGYELSWRVEPRAEVDVVNALRRADGASLYALMRWADPVTGDAAHAVSLNGAFLEKGRWKFVVTDSNFAKPQLYTFEQLRTMGLELCDVTRKYGLSDADIRSATAAAWNDMLKAPALKPEGLIAKAWDWVFPVKGVPKGQTTVTEGATRPAAQVDDAPNR